MPNILTFSLLLNQEQQAKLANLKYVLQETTEAGNDLTDSNENTEIPIQVTKVNDLHAEVDDLLDRAFAAENENLAKHGEFETLLDGFANKVDSLEKRLEDVKPLSTKLPELKAEQEEIIVSQTLLLCIRMCCGLCQSNDMLLVQKSVS